MIYLLYDNKARDLLRGRKKKERQRTPVFREQIYFDFSENIRNYEKQAEYLAIPKAKYK